MYFLPFERLNEYTSCCIEKLNSYQIIANLGLPVLKSIIVSNRELEEFGENEEKAIRYFLENNSCMLRYLYREANSHIKNGGKIISISKDTLLKEREEGADLWLFEPYKREDNIMCCNISLDRHQENLHMEFLGAGFDISDINKGEITPHEQIDIPYPIYYSMYGEWWKWAHFYFCTDESYQKSIDIRKKRLKEFGSDYEVNFEPTYKAVDKSTIECLFEWINLIETNWIGNKPDFYNMSCSFQRGGRRICWDIQTPKGKMQAYID